MLPARAEKEFGERGAKRVGVDYTRLAHTNGDTEN